MQQNSKCKLCGDKDETINHIKNEYRKLAQREYKTGHDWVGKVIHWELCKKFKFDHINKWYAHNNFCRETVCKRNLVWLKIPLDFSL